MNPPSSHGYKCQLCLGLVKAFRWELDLIFFYNYRGLCWNIYRNCVELMGQIRNIFETGSDFIIFKSNDFPSLAARYKDLTCRLGKAVP